MRNPFLLMALALAWGQPALAEDDVPPTACPCELVTEAGEGFAGKLRRALQHAREQLDLASELVEADGTANEEDQGLVVRHLAMLPREHLEQLKQQGTRVVVVRGGITEHWEHLAGQHPRGWPEDATFEDVPGAYIGGEVDTLVVAIRGHGTEEGPHITRDGLTLFHEVGHALDPASHAAGPAGSRSFWFMAAHTAEREDLDDYYQQEGHAGASEAFAETYARHQAGDEEWFDDRELLERYWERRDPLDPDAAHVAAAWPPAGHVAHLTPSFRWRRTSGRLPARYRLYLEDEHGQRRLVADSGDLGSGIESEGESLVFDPSNLHLEAGRTYRWRVGITEVPGETTFSEWRALRTAPDYRETAAPPSLILADSLRGGLPLPRVIAGKVVELLDRRPEAIKQTGDLRGREGLVGGLR